MTTDPKPAKPLADQPARIRLSGPTTLAAGYRPLERYDVELVTDDGREVEQRRDILRGGRVVGVLPIDLARDSVVLIRQFRLPAHLATGRGEMVEMVAGGVEAGEDIRRAAERECLEEIGIAPLGLVHLFDFLPTPGLTDEYAAIFAARVDAAELPATAGVDGEAEVVHPFLAPIDEAIAALDGEAIANGFLRIALQWLALNRPRLAALFEGAAA